MTLLSERFAMPLTELRSIRQRVVCDNAHQSAEDAEGMQPHQPDKAWSVTTTNIIASLAFDNGTSFRNSTRIYGACFFSLHEPRNSTVVFPRTCAPSRTMLSGHRCFDVFLFTGAETDNHFFVEETSEQASPIAVQLSPISRDFSVYHSPYCPSVP